MGGKQGGSVNIRLEEITNDKREWAKHIFSGHVRESILKCNQPEYPPFSEDRLYFGSGSIDMAYFRQGSCDRVGGL